MPGVMSLDPFREKAFTAALASPGESCTSGFGAHSRAKPVLTFAGAFRCLVSAFHDIGVAAAKEAAMLGSQAGLSMERKIELPGANHNCQQVWFLK